MAQLFAGTSGGPTRAGSRISIRKNSRKTKFLQHYSTQLNAVEVNFTFRQLLKETTAQKWIAETPDNFRFGIKAHQVITHIKRLKGTEEFVPRFFSTIEPLARAGKDGPSAVPVAPEHEGGCESASGISVYRSPWSAGGI